MPHEHFCLKWNNFQKNIVAALGNLKLDEDFVDVTLSCEGKTIKAHKVILSACSDYFRNVFRENPCKHPVIILRDSSFDDIEGLIRYVYRGEVDVQPEQLQSFLRTAELLQIKGLADQNLCNSTSDSETIPSPSNAGHENNVASQEEDRKITTSPTIASQIQALSQVIPSPNVSIQQQRCSSALSLTPPLLQQTSSTPQSASGANLNCANGKIISTTQQPCIKVPVPPTPHLSNLKRNNFTSLAQYLSGSTNYQSVTSPSSSLSPPHGESIDAKTSGCNIGGSVAKRRKTTPKRYKNITTDAPSNISANHNVVLVGNQSNYTGNNGNSLIQQTNLNIKGSSHYYSGSTSSVTASPSSPPHSHSTEGGDHQSALEICEESDRESARSTESTEILLNKSPSQSLTEYHVKHHLSTTVNSSIKQYLQHHNQLQDFNKSQSLINNTIHPYPYQQGHDQDENRLIIQEEDEAEMNDDVRHSDVEMDDTGTKLVILRSGNNYNNKNEHDSTTNNTTNYGETLDLSKGRECHPRGGIDNSETKYVLEGPAITLSASNLPENSLSTRLSTTSTIKSSMVSPNPTIPSISPIGTPGSIMTIVPNSQAPTQGGVIPMTISNVAQENVAALQSPISPHINLKGRSIEVLSSHNISIAASSLSGNAFDTTSNLTVSKSGAAPNIPIVVQVPQAHISSQPNQDSQHLGLVTNAITTVAVPSSEVQNSEATQQQQQLIAAAMASLSTSIPNAGIISQQTSPQSSSGNNSLSASIARSIYQATKSVTSIPITVAPNTSSGEIMSECKDYKNRNKATKGKVSRNNSKKARKSLLQEQQDVLQKNGKNTNESVTGKPEGCKNKSNFIDDGDTAQNDGRPGSGGLMGSNGSHPRNRWRCMQPRVCNYCWKTFSNSFNLKQHIVNVHVQSQGVSCSLCEKVVKNKWYLRKHLVTAHGAPLKRIKGNENGGSNLGTRDTVISQNTEITTKQSNDEQTESMDAAAAVAAAAAAANIPLASFVAAANSISQQQNTINNNISTSVVPNIHGNGQIFPFSHSNFASERNTNGSVIGIPSINERQRLAKVASSKVTEIGTKEDYVDDDDEEEEEELIVDG